MAPAAGSLHLTSHTIRPPHPRNPHRPWNARTPSDTGRLVIPIRHNQPHKLASTHFTRPEPTARKIEASDLIPAEFVVEVVADLNDVPLLRGPLAQTCGGRCYMHRSNMHGYQ